MRTTTPEHIDKFLLSVDSYIIKCWDSMSTGVNLSPTSRERVHLPNAKGGIGIILTRTVAPAAYVAAKIEATNLISTQIFKDDEPTMAAYKESLRPWLELLNGSVNFEDRVLFANVYFAYKGRNLQKSISEKIYQAIYDRLYAGASPITQSIMASLCKSKASYFSAPKGCNGHALTYNNTQLKTIFALILGAPVYSITSRGLVQCNTCSKQLLDPHGHHALACTRDGGLTTIHYKVTRILGDYLKKGGTNPAYEVSCDRDSGLVPGDLSVANYSAGKTLLMDVTGIHKLQILPVNPETGKRTVLTHILAREKEKNTKYRVHCRENGFLFQPFVFSTLGVLNGVADDFIREIAGNWAIKENLVYSHCVSRIKCHILFTIMAAATNAITLRNPQECFNDDGVLRGFQRKRRGSSHVT
jgi:hypothetical protein